MSSNDGQTFKDVFKYYKRRDRPLNLNGICDIKTIGVKRVGNTGMCGHGCLGLLDPDQWEMYELPKPRGLILIKNPFSSMGQRYWIARCLKSYTKKPNKSNIDVHNYLDKSENWWEFCQSDKGCGLLEKLRWVTLGYQHNWDTKEYTEQDRVMFPDDLQALSSYVARVMGYSDFKAEAAIINMYHMGSTLSGHTDHSEPNFSAPLFSFSFGQSAVFLIGGSSLEEEPCALLVESGDVVIMSGESRLSYHGIPRVVPTEAEPWSADSGEERNLPWHESYNGCITCDISNNESWLPFGEYVAKSRINMNVRQVLFLGQQVLP